MLIGGFFKIPLCRVRLAQLILKKFPNSLVFNRQRCLRVFFLNPAGQKHILEG